MIPALVRCDSRRVAIADSGMGLPLDWFDQQFHVTAHRMDNLPTMTMLADRSVHKNGLEYHVSPILSLGPYHHGARVHAAVCRSLPLTETNTVTSESSERESSARP